MHPDADHTQPNLASKRLILRPFVPADAPRVAELAGARSIADTTISVPHPYPLEMVHGWIGSHAAAWRAQEAIHFAIEPCPNGGLAGAISLRGIDWTHLQAELGFWIGEPFWGRGLATEAVLRILPFAFETLALNRIHAHHMCRNPASGRVLEKAGFRREGLLRQRVVKWGQSEDVVLLALLREEWMEHQSQFPQDAGA